MIVVDTNVLIYFADKSDPKNSVIKAAVEILRRTQEIRTTSQNLIEMWNVLTRPVEKILTLNTGDFRRFADQGIQAIDPNEV